MKIYLVGMPFSGKTFIGLKLAEKLSFNFIDINTEIEKEALMFMDEIYTNLGEETVKYQEKILLEKLLKEDNIVIVTTCSVVEDRKNKNLIDGIVIYLTVSDQILEKRKNEGYPNFLVEKYSIEDLSKKRFLLYQNFATDIVENEEDYNKTIDQILKIVTNSWYFTYIYSIIITLY